MGTYGCVVIFYYLFVSAVDLCFYCGDEVVYFGNGEECDDGNVNDGDGCLVICANEICYAI